MKPHTTHFDDCGCLLEKLNEALLRAKAAEDVAIKYRILWGEIAEPVGKYARMAFLIREEIEKHLLVEKRMAELMKNEKQTI